MEYILFFVAIIIGLILLDKLINRNAKKEFEEELKANWGKRNDEMISDEEFNRIRFYFDKTKGEYDIDDITWNDLDMNTIYSKINRTNSYIGREFLYAMLRRQDFNKEHLIKKNSVIDMFSKKENIRRKIQVALCNIGNKSDISVYEYLTRINDEESRTCLTSKVQDLLLLIAIILIVINNKFGLVLGLVMIAVNVATYYSHKARIAPYLSFFSYVIRMNRSLDDICTLDCEEIKDYQDRLEIIKKKLYKLRKRSFLLANSSISGGFFDMVMDYVKMLCHVDIMKFYSMLNVIKDNKEYIKEMYEILGEIDSLSAVASFRETLPYYCIPDFIDTKKYISDDSNLLVNSNENSGKQHTPEDSEKGDENVLVGNITKYICEEVYHPLIENAVSNSIETEGSVLLTGSNASGKSTFIRTLALNALLSQTIFTGISKSYVAPFYQIYSSMALRDNLLGGESYYMVEIKSLKRVLNTDTSKYPVLCFIDEVLRGTNTLERIAASAHILGSIAKNNALCFAATHDIELTKILKHYYNSYHFREEVLENDIKFDYKLYKGSAKSRNAIKLLSVIGYDKSIVNNATNMAGDFLENGVWEVID